MCFDGRSPLNFNGSIAWCKAKDRFYVRAGEAHERVTANVCNGPKLMYPNQPPCVGPLSAG